MRLLTPDELVDCAVYEYYPGAWREDVPNMRVACRYYMTETKAVHVGEDGVENEWALGVARAEVARLRYVLGR